MNINVKQAQGKVPVSIMKLDGELDAKCYMDVIVEAKNLYDSGARDLLIDMSGLNFMASSGLVSLHSIALIMGGQQPPGPSDGWSTFRTDHIQIGHESKYEEHCKLLNPTTRISRTLDMVGFAQVFEIFEDAQLALSSFG